MLTFGSIPAIWFLAHNSWITLQNALPTGLKTEAVYFIFSGSEISHLCCWAKYRVVFIEIPHALRLARARKNCFYPYIVNIHFTLLPRIELASWSWNKGRNTIFLSPASLWKLLKGSLSNHNDSRRHPAPTESNWSRSLSLRNLFENLLKWDANAFRM